MSFVSSHKYYIVFADDFPRTYWVYFLRDRVHVLDVVKQFFAEIINQFVVTLKIFHTDNVLEFVQTELQKYCATLGVLHQTTCPNTSQQNGVAEYKHRHILDVTRTLMLQMHVPKYI